MNKIIVLLLLCCNICRASISLTWDAPTTNTDGSELVDLSHYKMYVWPSNGASYVTDFFTNLATFATLTEGSSYCFVVTAVNSNGVESDPSNTFCTNIPITVLPEPKNVALHKKVVGTNGKWWSNTVDGISSGYTDLTGFGYTLWKNTKPVPGTMTLDLETTNYVDAVVILLWDLDARYSRYKLESSETGIYWEVVRDYTGDEYTMRGRQYLLMDFPRRMRYLKLTGTYSSANAAFCVVEWEVYTRR